MTLGALTLYDRPKVRLFMHKECDESFFSVVLYLPRERYSTDLVQKINHYLCGYFQEMISSISHFLESIWFAFIL